MNRLSLLLYGIISASFLQGCDTILEPVSLYAKSEQDIENQQENFPINILPLTFFNAKKANNDPYPRVLMRTGSGIQANVLNESNFLNSTFPRLSKKTNYSIGIGDELSFSLQSEFIDKQPQWPPFSTPQKYLIGTGDELSFIQQTETKILATPLSGDSIASLNPISRDVVINSKGIVGNNGNILLLGLGNINVGNRSLDDVRAEVRNILIRDGLNPNFQLEITKFRSQKAFITSDHAEKTASINYINDNPISVKELILSTGLSKSTGHKALITLTRNDKEYRNTAQQILSPSAPDIYVLDNDEIDIKFAPEELIAIKTIVDSQGKMLLPSIGTIKSKGKTLESLQKEISKILYDDGLKPYFQLELSGFNSKKVYLISNNETMLIPLTNKDITLRELVFKNNPERNTSTGLDLYTLQRGGKKYQITSEQLLNPNNQDIWVQDEDQIKIETLEYKPGQVFALSGTNNAEIVSIKPSVRETLADVLFVPNGALSNTFAKRSEVYLIRGRSPLKAYHLDAQDVSRILVAAQTQLRPNDIIFVAERPIISFARTLAEITPLRILLRDIQDDEIP